MNLKEAIDRFNLAGFHTKPIKTLTIEIEGFHVGKDIRHVEGEGDYIIGDFFTIINDNGIWTAHISSQGILKSSESLKEVVDAVCNYYGISNQ